MRKTLEDKERHYMQWEDIHDERGGVNTSGLLIGTLR